MCNYSHAELSEIVSREFLTPGEAAVLLNTSKANVSNLVQKGALVPIKKSRGSRLFLRSEVEAYKTARENNRKAKGTKKKSQY